AGIAERTRHGRQTTLRITSTHGRSTWTQRVLTAVARFLRSLTNAAEQLTLDDRWLRILAHAMRAWLKGRQLRAPPRLMAPSVIQIPTSRSCETASKRRGVEAELPFLGLSEQPTRQLKHDTPLTDL